MKKQIKALLSVALVISLISVFPNTSSAVYRREFSGFESCCIPDPSYSVNIRVNDLSDESDSEHPFYYTVPDGGAAVLIFFSVDYDENGYGRFSYMLLSAIAKSSWITNEKITVTAIETSEASKTDTQAYINEYTGDKTGYFNVFYGSGGDFLYWYYYDLLSAVLYKPVIYSPMVLVIGNVEGAPAILNFADAVDDTDELTKRLSLITDSVTYTEADPGSEYKIREGDNTDEHFKGDIIFGLEGTFVTVDEEAKEAVLKRVNEIRKEACDNGYPIHNRPLTPEDYKPIKWSNVIEAFSASRAAEATILKYHNRLSKHESYFSIPVGENLAWPAYTPIPYGIINAIDQFYREKDAYLGKASGQTGHYAAMINPYNISMGIAGFYNACDDCFAVAMNFSRDDDYYNYYNDPVAGIGGKVYQKIKIDKELVMNMVVDCKQCITPDDTTNARVYAYIYNEYTNHTVGYGIGIILSDLIWESSDPSVASVDENGVVTGHKDGDAVITATLPDIMSASLDIKVRSKNNHNLVHHEAADATHYENGSKEYWECTECGNLYSDPECNTELTEDDITIPALKHAFEGWKCSEYSHWNECGCGYKSNLRPHMYYDDENVCIICGYGNIKGDINRDGEANNKDVVTMFRYVSSGGVNTAYDFNTDGEVNNKDVVALFRYISG